MAINSGVSDKVCISDYDLKIMVDDAKELHGDDSVAVTKSVISQIQYAEMVSNDLKSQKKVYEGEGAGKGDTPRPGSKKNWDENWPLGEKEPEEFQKDKESKPGYDESN